MNKLSRIIAASLLGAVVAMPAFAQEAPETAPPEAPAEAAPEAPADAPGEAATPGEGAPAGDLGLSMGQPEGGEEVGRTYVAEEFGDWDMRCVRTENGIDPCQLYQLLEDENGNSVAEISVFALPEGEQAAAGATVITPLETLLTADVALRVDNGGVKRYPFSWCSTNGCFSRIGFTSEDLASFRRGRQATLSIRPVAAPDQTVDLAISLMGFTAGYDAVRDSNAAAREQLEQQQQQ